MSHRGKPITEQFREIRRKHAEAHQAEYDTLTTAQKIQALDNKLGKGIGAQKQRARLSGKVKQPVVAK